MESSYCLTHLCPMNTEVRLHDQSRVTVPVFDAKAMILDLLSNENLMNKSNIAEGYDVFSGDVGMSKFQSYIKRYGSAMNFYGGTGESAHKQFVKAPGQENTASR